MTREGTIGRLGVDIGALDTERLPDPLVPECPGAKLRLTRHDFDTYVQGGEYFETERKDIPFDGYGDARVRCEQPVAQLPKTMSMSPQYYGLCTSCSGLEVRNRQELRDRAKARGER